MSILLQDIRFALRQLLKQPAFSVVAVLSLALGIAASVTLFSVIYRVLLRPTPYRNADRVVRFVDLNDKTETEYTPPIYRDQIRQLKESRSIDDVVEMDERYLADSTLEIPRDTDVVLLSGNAFPFFGVPAMLGRTFLPSDAPSGQAPQPVAVLTYQYWRRRFNGNPAILGQTLRLDNRSYTILGVMPRSFNWWDSDLYLPLDTSDPSRQAFMTVLRLKPGVSKTQAMAEIHPILEQMIHEHPHSGFDQMNIQLMSTADRYRRSLGNALYILLAAVLLLLVIGCVNVSILLLARGVTRQREFAVRLALGASPARVVRQLLTESLVLGFAGTVLGVIATYRTATLVAPLLPWQLFTHGLEIPVPLPVLGFAVALATLTGVFVGLFPAVQVLKPEIRPILQANSRHATANIPGRRLYSILIAGQIAFAMVLLTAAATAINSLRLLQQTDLGYDPNHVADFPIPIHPGSYTTWESRANYLRQLRDRVAQVPGAVSASLGVIGPPASDWDFSVEILGQNATSSQTVNVNFVDSQFFQVLRIPLLQGRLWDEAETARGARLALVNQAFVRRYSPNQDVLGHSVRVSDLVNHPPGILAAVGSNEWGQIIAVVGDARNNGLEDPVKPEIYFPYSLYMIDWIQVFVRAQGDPMSLETDVRRQIANVNPGQQVSDPVFSLTTRLEQESAWARSHLLAVLSSIFSVLALILTSVGLYSVISYTVSQRVNEFGIRIALGAERHHILLNVLQSQTRPLGAGLLIGLFLSVGAHRLLAHLISSTPTDLWTLGVVCLVFLIVSLLASVIPAIQASRRPPMDALRME